jgi:hypothetical protein
VAVLQNVVVLVEHNFPVIGALDYFAQRPFVFTPASADAAAGAHVLITDPSHKPPPTL